MQIDEIVVQPVVDFCPIIFALYRIALFSIAAVDSSYQSVPNTASGAHMNSIAKTTSRV
ncbi:hypothetical protein [Paenibacillus hemerocallicola]|uniref:hypothetical protein n=1 Tax=Paenibacillus hemerocallicola TaxID=1172614 RepID=UPI00159EC712|nr:hypothetical protein [Paenibacillus hemerocallicola]